MKISKLITTAGLVATFFTAQLTGLLDRKPKEASAQTAGEPYIILVNGNADCCVWSTTSSLYMSELWNIPNAEFRMTPWDHFNHGGKQRRNIDIGKLGSYSASNDAEFINEAARIIHNGLDPNRPLILIGHSYGGDSLLKLAPRIHRRIQFLGVIDPVGAGGFRLPLRDHGVPSNVDFFFNRWQENGLALDNAVPFDSRGSGAIRDCRAKRCDQAEASIARNPDGSAQTELCGWAEVTCPGYSLLPPRRGRKQKRMAHNSMPYDPDIQRQVLERVNQAIANFTPPSSASSVGISAGLYRLPDGNFISANDSGAFCSFVSPAHFEFLSGRYDLVQSINSDRISAMANHGACAVRLPAGAYRLVDGRIIASNGSAFCRYVSYEHYERKDKRPIRQFNGEIPLHAMENHFNCHQ